MTLRDHLRTIMVLLIALAVTTLVVGLASWVEPPPLPDSVAKATVISATAMNLVLLYAFLLRTRTWDRFGLALTFMVFVWMLVWAFFVGVRFRPDTIAPWSAGTSWMLAALINLAAAWLIVEVFLLPPALRTNRREERRT